jgi:hypothetical protein
MKFKNWTQPFSWLMITWMVLFWVSVTDIQASPSLQSPEKYFGFQPGTDRMLFDYGQLIGYLKKLDQASPRIEMFEIGKSPLGKKIYLTCISSENNLKNLNELKEINRKLALYPDLSEKERESCVSRGRVFVLSTLSMHSGEVSPSQAAPLIAYQLATTRNTDYLTILDNVVLIMVPCHNPDGMDMVVNHYRKYKGTKYEGSSMPGIYHKYVGHDNNRDFITLTQEDNQAVARVYSHEWFPQVMMEKHQMGSTTARYFVPPNHDPIAENIDARLWNWCGIFGSNMIKDMTNQGLAGVSQHYLFDFYWPGSTETSMWKNVISFLTEGASVNYATPIFVEPNELKGYGKGLAEYKKSTNMPLPWPGGWWRLSDLVTYEVVSTLSVLKTASNHRRDILMVRNDLCRDEVQKGKTKPPFYYILPLDQHDRSELVETVNLLKEHGISVYRLTRDMIVNGKFHKKADLVLPMSQPFRAFLKEVMEKQIYPIRHYTPGGKIIRPYDVTSWSLPLHRGLTCFEVNKQIAGFDQNLEKIDKSFSLNLGIPPIFWAAAFSANCNESYKVAFKASEMGLKVERLKEMIRLNHQDLAPGSFLVYHQKANHSKMTSLLDSILVSPVYIKDKIPVKTVPLQVPRIALVETYFHDMDAGWTRYLFDSYSIPYTVIRPGDFENIDFRKRFEVVVFPDISRSILMTGKWKYEDRYYISEYPPGYSKGIGKEGLKRLMNFLETGGIIISWGKSASLFTGTLEVSAARKPVEAFQLPFEDISPKLKKAGFYCPGALLKLDLLTDHPITRGMGETIGIFLKSGLVFETYIPSFDMDRRVIGKISERDILLSGYCEKVSGVANKTLLLWLKKNRGQLVLFGFNPQFRASTNGTFKLVFNSILLPRL